MPKMLSRDTTDAIKELYNLGWRPVDIERALSVSDVSVQNYCGRAYRETLPSRPNHPRNDAIAALFKNGWKKSQIARSVKLSDSTVAKIITSSQKAQNKPKVRCVLVVLNEEPETHTVFLTENQVNSLIQ